MGKLKFKLGEEVMVIKVTESTDFSDRHDYLIFKNKTYRKVARIKTYEKGQKYPYILDIDNEEYGFKASELRHLTKQEQVLYSNKKD